MASTIIEKLIYGTAIDLTGAQTDAQKLSRTIRFLGAEAKQTFERDFGRSLAKSIDPKNFQADLNKARTIINNFGKDAQNTFQRTLGTQISKGFFNANSQAKGFFQTLVAGSSNLSRFHALLAGGIGAGFVAGQVIDSLARMTKASVSFAASFETSLAKVRTIADDGISLKTIEDELKGLSQRVPQDLINLTEGVFDIIGSGIKNTADALNVLEVSAKAAVAGVSSTSEASRAIVFLLNAFGKSATEAAHISDILFETVDEGVVSFGALAQQIGDVASPAALAGVSIEDLGAAFAVSTKAGIDAAETATGLKNAILSIVAPTDQAAKAAEELGLDFSKAGIAAAGGFKGLLDQIQKATKGDIKSIEKLFPEKRALREIAILSGTMADEFQRLAGNMNDVGKVSGATEKAFAIMNATAENQYKLFKNNLNLAILEFGENILESALPALRELNFLLADISPIERYAALLRQIGASSEEIASADAIARTEKLQNRIKELNEDIQDLTDASDESISAQFGLEGGKAFAEFLETAQVIPHIQQRIAEENEHIIETVKRLGEATTEGNKENVNALEFELRTSENRRNALFKLLELRRSLTEQQKKYNEEVSGGGGASAEQGQVDTAKEYFDIKKLTIEQLKELIQSYEKPLSDEKKIVKEAKEQLALLEKQAKEREKALDFIQKARNELELLNAPTELDRKLIQIRQEADERRKMFKDQADAIKAVYALERAEIARTLATRGGITLGTPTRGSFSTFNERSFIPLSGGMGTRTPTRGVIGTQQIRIPEIRADISGFKKLAGDIQDALAAIGKPIASFVIDLENAGVRIDELAEFGDLIDRRLGDIISSIGRFSTAIAEQNIFGAINSSIGIISGLFDLLGGTDIDRRNEEFRERQAAEQERLAQLTNELTNSFERLSDSIKDFGVAQLTQNLDDVKRQIRDLAGATSDLSLAQIQSLQAMQRQLGEVETQIRDFEEAGRSIPEELISQRDALLASIEALGGGIRNLTAEEVIRLEALFNELGLINTALEEFGAFANNFQGIINRLNLEFELFNIDDPVEKLKKLQQSIIRQFGAIIPNTEQAIRDFISQGFAAIQAGGDTLVNLLKSLNLEELTADQFAELLSLLNGLANDAKDQLDEIDSAAQEIGISAIKAITFEQGNRISDELATMRIIATQQYELLRSGNLFVQLAQQASSPLFAVRNNYFLVRDASFTQIGEESLNVIDKLFVERMNAAARAAGVN